MHDRPKPAADIPPSAVEPATTGRPPSEETFPTAAELSCQSTDFGLGPDRDAAQTAALVGRDLGEFRIERLLAQGGMGRVYVARQRSPDRLVAVSPHEEEVAVGSGAALPHQIRVIMNGLADEELRLREPKAKLRRELGLPEGAPVVGAIGRLGRQKGYDVFIRAARLIHERRPDVHFLLVGKGPYDVPLRKLASELGLDNCFHFTGERNDVLDIFPLIDVFVMSSRWEAMPYALLEAMGAARPIVLPPVCGLEKLVENGRAAAIIPPEDPEAICRAVCELLDDEPHRRALGRAAHDIATSRYALRRSIREIERLYEEAHHDR